MVNDGRASGKDLPFPANRYQTFRSRPPGLGIA